MRLRLETLETRENPTGPVLVDPIWAPPPPLLPPSTTPPPPAPTPPPPVQVEPIPGLPPVNPFPRT